MRENMPEPHIPRLDGAVTARSAVTTNSTQLEVP